MPAPPAGKRQRRWAPKTRTGCKTCKIRRKKCDEKKPSCARCVKDKFPCDGYEPAKVWMFEPSGESWVESSAPNVWTLPSRSPSTKGKDEMACLQSQDGVEVEDFVETENQTPSTRDLVLRDPHHSDFLLEPSSPWTTSLDQNYTEYFLLKTAPLLSSTKRWQNFWQRIVPQAAWANVSVRHAMIAVSLTFDTYISGADHKAMILSRRKRAINAFATEPSSSWEIGLIICRLFSSMAQCSDDFEGAMAHMRSGEKMLLEASQNARHRTSEVVRLMAATFMGLFADSTIDFDVIQRFPPRERQIFRVLQKMCSEWAMMLRRITAAHWEETIETRTMGFLSVVFTTFNQAISSAMYPDILVFAADEGILPVREVRAALVAEDQLLSFQDLKATYHALFDEVETHFDKPLPAPPAEHPPTAPNPSKHAIPRALLLRLRTFVDNYVVQASELEPRMTAGTFWSPNAHLPEHLIEQAHDEPKNGAIGCLHRPWRNDSNDDWITRERREYYHEFVCQYRSGFMC